MKFKDKLKKFVSIPKTLLKFAINTYGIFTGIWKFSINMYLSITVYTHKIIFGNIYAIIENVN